ncbi:hypothetical protein [Aeoliella sp.]|uniref:hypothetical protein n=1 Tax=Aeoliella sp. TaxID=2795800 RepID=UPI003CCBBADA
MLSFYLVAQIGRILFAKTAIRRFAAMVLAGAIFALGGCAALNPGPQCHCPKCEQQVHADEQMLVDLQQGFRDLVLGTDHEKDSLPPRRASRRPQRQVAQHRSTDRRTAQRKSPIRKVSNTAPAEVVEAPAAESAALATVDAGNCEAPPAEVSQACCELSLCPTMGPAPVVGPPPRFFPVPARPVFSPQPPGYGVPAAPALEPLPMSNWGESTDASL